MLFPISTALLGSAQAGCSGVSAALDGGPSSSADGGTDAGEDAGGLDATTGDGTTDATTSDVGADAADATDATRASDGTGAPDAAPDVVDATADAADATGGFGAADAADAADACVPTPEQCNNGLDDDCNGLIDCADPTCAEYVCADAVPAGWLGPLAIQTQPGAAPPAACAAPYATPAFTAYSGLDAPANACPADQCACGPVTGFACSAPRLGLFVYAGFAPTPPCPPARPCDQFYQCNMNPQVHANGCTSVSCSGCTAPAACMGGSIPCSAYEGWLFLSSGGVATGGACSPIGANPAPLPWSWSNRAQACSLTAATSGGGCGAASMCIPRPDGAGTRLCIARAGDQACPAGSFSERTVDYGGATDTRSCSCGCSPPATSGTCSLEAKLYGSNDCTGSAVTANGNACTMAAFVSSYQFEPEDTSRSCAAQPNAPSGQVTASDPWTVCCQP